MNVDVLNAVALNMCVRVLHLWIHPCFFGQTVLSRRRRPFQGRWRSWRMKMCSCPKTLQVSSRMIYLVCRFDWEALDGAQMYTDDSFDRWIDSQLFIYSILQVSLYHSYHSSAELGGRSHSAAMTQVLQSRWEVARSLLGPQGALFYVVFHLCLCFHWL